MFGHRSFLILGGESPADIKSLTEGGYEISDCRFPIEQGVDYTGKVTTRVYFGRINIILSQLPPKEIIEWGINSRRYHDGAIVVLDANNIPLEKVIFKNAACIRFKMNYTEYGDSYITTEIALQAQKLIVDDGIEFDNEWIY
ncbi:MAG: type VI secretion system needle protein Hcp [Tannerella sp.]|jgi:hypothetical protein|nr:type VI secretion system needle protein Hcp [Tannerella sp.]